MNLQNTNAAKILSDNGIEVINDFGIRKHWDCFGNLFTCYTIQVKDYYNGICCSESIRILKEAGFEKVGFTKTIESLREYQYICIDTNRN